MRIRCERCATTYELDEKRLPPHGALVKCTRCDHVFRAAPPVAGAAAAPGPEATPPPPAGPPAGEERTAIFGYAAVDRDEQTARIPPPSPSLPARSGPARSGEGRSGATAQQRPVHAGSVAPPGKGARWTWWVLAALLLAAAAGIGWWVVQSRAATPTTRLPAGAELLPT